ncbi:MAG: nucleoside kinase [Candidatus Cloacimonetes bacterium]|nr:nucleoside kinase [Candidatus Cloacimonadota bacterium]
MDGTHHNTIVYPGPISIREVIDDEEIRRRSPLAFRIGNEYVNQDFEVAANCQLDCVTHETLDGMRIYQDTAIFMLMKAFHNLYPDHLHMVVEHSIGDGLFCEIFGGHKTEPGDAVRLKDEMQRIADAAIRIERTKIPTREADDRFAATGREDVRHNLRNLARERTWVYRCGDYWDYYIRQLAENTSFVSEFDLAYHSPGLILRLPRWGEQAVSATVKIPQKLYALHQEHDKWLGILKLHFVYELNDYVSRYEIGEAILVEEALHEKKLAQMADEIKQREQARIVLIAGPSCSGKTTFAKRLYIQLRVNGLMPRIIGMDDYFHPRRLTPHKPNGEYDFECIEAIDVELLNDHLTRLLAGEEVGLPHYNFQSGERDDSHHPMRLSEGDVIVLEGIHGINDRLTQSIAPEHKVRIYISPLNQLNIDRHNRIPTTDVRKVRRIVRDAKYRGYTAEDTLIRWPAIREGEEKNIFPFQENADLMFNSSLTYELGVMKKHAMPLLTQVSSRSPVYHEATRLGRILDHFHDIPDNHVPSNSLLREFTFGSVFKY